MLLLLLLLLLSLLLLLPLLLLLLRVLLLQFLLLSTALVTAHPRNAEVPWLAGRSACQTQGATRSREHPIAVASTRASLLAIAVAWLLPTPC
jgi:hypothetical protein